MKSIQKYRKKIVPFNENLLKGMPQSISETVPVQDNYINYLPLLFDMYHVDINYNFLLDSTLKNISIFQDLDDFTEDLKSKIYTPIVLPFADTKEFLNIFGQMLESLTKPQEYQIFYNRLQEIYNKNKHDSRNRIFSTTTNSGQIYIILENTILFYKTHTG